jgi:hypothetical protein
MDHRELEEKLEKDNITLKEHIMKLQNTIKQIKGEITSTDLDHKTKSIEKKPNKKNKESIHKASDDEEHLKFSFNNTNMQVPEAKQEERRVPNKPGNLYQENLQKIRNEKDTVLKMEQVKRKANIRRKYSDDSDSEINKFHKNYKERRMSDDDEEISVNNNHRNSNAPVFKDSKLILNIRLF